MCVIAKQVVTQQQSPQQQNQQGNLQTPVSSAGMTNMAPPPCLPPVQHQQASATGFPNMASIQGLPPGQHPQQIR